MATEKQMIAAHGISFQPGGNVTFSSTDAITAHAGGGQANAVELTTQINNVTVVATAADSVKLPSVATTAAFPDGPLSNLGNFVIVINSSATTCSVYPSTGGTINGLAANASVSVAGGEVALFAQTAALTWFSDTASAAIVTSFILNGATSGSTTVNAAAIASGTLTLPAATDTLIGKATTDTLTNKTFDTAATGNSFSINGVAATANTGTGAVARATSPAFVTPGLGAATATTINRVTITAPATAATLTLADNKTATINNSLTLAGTDTTTMTFPATSATIARTDAPNTFTGPDIFSAMFRVPRATVAAAGTVLADAAQLANGYTTVTAGDGTKGVKLVATPAAGSMALVKNNSAAVLKVWPDAAATINAIGANGAISMAANTIAIFMADSTTQWYTLPLLPS